jgi:hypothetical protein
MNNATFVFTTIAVATTALLHARREYLDRFIAKAKIYEPRPRTRTRSATPPHSREDIPDTVVVHP